MNDGIMKKQNLRLVALFAVLAATFVACIGLPDRAAAFTGRITLHIGGARRTALIIEHERLKRARRPVIVVLHGGKGVNNRLRHHLGLERMIRSSAPVMVYPDAIGGYWHVTPSLAAKHDLLFVKKLVTKLIADGIADRHRIFLVGSSSGGLMALRLACQHSRLFAGAAILIASLPKEFATSCHPSPPLRFLMIAGTADPFIPYQGGRANLVEYKAELLPVEETLALFAKAAGCNTAKTVTQFPHHDAKNPTQAYLEKFTRCKVPVEFVRIEGGGHWIPGRWKGGERGKMAGPYNNDFSSAALIWELFHNGRR
jgi:polyhydroxybutyrate depolymerase